MNREIHKTITWYRPNKDDMKLCADCARGWAFYCSDASGLYVHKPNEKTEATICRAVNKKIPTYLRSRVTEAA